SGCGKRGTVLAYRPCFFADRRRFIDRLGGLGDAGALAPRGRSRLAVAMRAIAVRDARGGTGRTASIAIPVAVSRRSVGAVVFSILGSAPARSGSGTRAALRTACSGTSFRSAALRPPIGSGGRGSAGATRLAF